MDHSDLHRHLSWNEFCILCCWKTKPHQVDCCLVIAEARQQKSAVCARVKEWFWWCKGCWYCLFVAIKMLAPLCSLVTHFCVTRAASPSCLPSCAHTVELCLESISTAALYVQVVLGLLAVYTRRVNWVSLIKWLTCIVIFSVLAGCQ